MYSLPLKFNNMNSIQNNSRWNYTKKQISFGQIKPEMLFIEIPGFEKDYNWANVMIKTIDKTSKTIKAGTFGLTNILDGLKTDYRKYYINNKPKGSENTNFGVDRKSDLLTEIIGRYRSYFDRASQLVLRDYEIVDEEKIGHTTTAEFDKNLKLTKTIYNLENLEMYWQHTDVKNIPSVMKHSANIYNDIKELDKEIPQSSNKNIILNKINKKVAELHWYMANSTPYGRGSAGITDILIKSIYESMNIQVDAWKKGLAPDLEAFVTPLDEFIEKYPTYFSSPPKFM